ncbi:hypothetical protein [Rhodanobacter lindaniclasticus]
MALEAEMPSLEAVARSGTARLLAPVLGDASAAGGDAMVATGKAQLGVLFRDAEAIEHSVRSHAFPGDRGFCCCGIALNAAGDGHRQIGALVGHAAGDQPSPDVVVHRDRTWR